VTETRADRDVFDEIREACRSVAAEAQFVRIEEERVSTYAQSLEGNIGRPPDLDAERHYVGDQETTTAYFVALDAINFGSGYFPHLRRKPEMSGYYTIASALADRFRREGPIGATDLAAISAAGCAKLFGQQDVEGPIRELMALFAQSWNDLGRDLVERFEGRFTYLVEAAGNSATRLVELLHKQPMFRDEALYRDMLVPFYKRAQILASDLALALDGRGFGRFDDLQKLTIFADNLVPHVLRLDGILTYDRNLLDRIEGGDLLAAGSEEEIEIRACAVHAVELVAENLRLTNAQTTSRDLDILLWTRGQRPEYKAHPRHRTRSPFY